MPRYDYACGYCGLEFEARQPVEERNTAECPYCADEAKRVFIPTRYIQTPEHFRHMQSDFLPDSGDTAAWEARQGGSTRHSPRQPRLREAFDAVKQWE